MLLEDMQSLGEDSVKGKFSLTQQDCYVSAYMNIVLCQMP